jgi:quercetin dioxygenase-like cupin family protein
VIVQNTTGTYKPENDVYCSELVVIKDNRYEVPDMATAYGYDFGAKQFFCEPIKPYISGDMVLFVKHGFIGQTVSGLVEKVGRVQYIDGCTDSLLVSPPRKGDPCLNSLHFPKETEQTMHTHPTVRLGTVVKGRGYAELKDQEIELNVGDAFIIEPHEEHRFVTTYEGMIVVAYHPDSDFGCTDEVHPMKNRTYINGRR